MCTSIIEIARAEGMAKRGDEWFPLSQAVVAYDHARHAPLGDVITLDFTALNVDDDVSVSDAVDRVLVENGRIDVLVNNAGVSGPAHTAWASSLTLSGRRQ
jgi:NAD(P)-dependent dehydrogenase (short-subunit alcohol dehydrogenase family)